MTITVGNTAIKGDQRMNWDAFHRSSFSHDLQKHLFFSSRPVHVFEIRGSADGVDKLPSITREQLLDDVAVENWLATQAKDTRPCEWPTWSLRVLVLERAPENEHEKSGQSSASSLSHIGLSMANFVRLIKEFGFQKSFRHTLEHNAFMYSAQHPQSWTKGYSFLSFNIRTNPAMLHDKAMTLRYDAEKASTAVLIQGCVAAERDELYKWLHTMQRFAGHPLLAIALFFEMYSRDLRETYDNLHTKYLEHFLETFSTDIDRLNKYRPHLKHATDMYDDQMTAQAEISAIQGRLARLIASIEYVTDKSPPGPRGDYMQEYGGKIKDRLLAMSDDLDYLHTKCANTKEGLQLLISAVGSMSALAESEISQQLAMTGHQVSIASKRDSTIMKAIAVGTLTFLPATAIASIFAMPVLDWDHPPGQGVAGRQFGIYLAVSIPMTLVTLMFLFAWMNMVDFEAETAKTSIRPSIRLRLGRLTAGLLLAQKPAINNVSKP